VWRRECEFHWSLRARRQLIGPGIGFFEFIDAEPHCRARGAPQHPTIYSLGDPRFFPTCAGCSARARLTWPRAAGRRHDLLLFSCLAAFVTGIVIAAAPRGSRNRAILNEEFLAALLCHFRREGERAIARMARIQPAAYCKLLGLLIPKEHKVEHKNAIGELSDQQLNDMIEALSARLSAPCWRSFAISGPTSLAESIEHSSTASVAS
jgi:hypothetical protein